MRTLGVKKHIIRCVKAAVGFAFHKDTIFQQVIGARGGIGLGQHGTAVAEQADVARINAGNVDARPLQVGRVEFVDARLDNADFVPVAVCQNRILGVCWKYEQLRKRADKQTEWFQVADQMHWREVLTSCRPCGQILICRSCKFINAAEMGISEHGRHGIGIPRQVLLLPCKLPCQTGGAK